MGVTVRGRLTLGNSIPVLTGGLQMFLDASDQRSYKGTGNTWFDLTGNGFNFIDDPSYAQGSTFVSEGGTSHFSWDNSSSISHYFQVPQNTDLSLGVAGTNPTLSYSFWARFDRTSYTGSQAVVGMGVDRREFDSSGNTVVDGVLNYSTSYRAIDTDNSVMELNSDPFAINANQTVSSFIGEWNNYTYVLEYPTSTTRRVYFYINNVEYSNSTGAQNTAQNEDFTLDALTNITLAKGNLIGDIATFSLYNVALSPSQVTENYNRLKSRFGHS